MTAQNKKELYGRERVYCWGYGRLGKLFAEHAEIDGFLDNDAKKQGHADNGLPVYSLEDVLTKHPDRSFFIIIVTGQHSREISLQLEKQGLERGKDFCTFREWGVRIYEQTGELLQQYLELYVTDRCTLKCKACAEMIPYVEHPEDCSLENLKADIDAYFRVVDFLLEFRILGGEPLIYSHLAELLRYLDENYRTKIGRIKLVTNGTVIPNENLLSTISDAHAELDISDYSERIELARKQRAKLVDVLNHHNIDFAVMPMKSWVEMYHMPFRENVRTEDGHKSFFQTCDYGCRTIWQKKFYFCAIDCAVKRMGKIADLGSDCLSLDVQDKDAIARKLLDYDRGIFERGYLEFCKSCGGGMNCNHNAIPVADQI